MLSILTIANFSNCTQPSQKNAGKVDMHETVLAQISEKIARIASPGILSHAHEKSDAGANCLDCHALFKKTPDQKCLECHSIVGERQAKSLGVHGGFTQNCVDCHSEHRGRETSSLNFDPKSFNHDQALFVLHGKHREKDCQDCHQVFDAKSGEEKFHYLGIDHETCATCHTDPHAKNFSKSKDCAACHTEIDWSILKDRLTAAPKDENDSPSNIFLDDVVAFSHSRDTAFALEDSHAKLACQSCHTPERRKLEVEQNLQPGTGVSRKCVDCHKDPHERALKNDCAVCHTPKTWQKTKFDHARDTKFSLTQVHRRVECSACHTDLRFRVQGTNCVDCHADAAKFLSGQFNDIRLDADPHSSPKISCNDCHIPTRDSTRLHNYEQACVQCHPPSYGKLLFSKQHILDELVVESESELRRLELSDKKQELDATSAKRKRLAKQLIIFSKNGAHHHELAEALLKQALESLHRERDQQP